jgi:hypothetical protein
VNLILSPVFRRSQWQDTSSPPNIIIKHLGPGGVSLDLQVYLDIANQSYHRDSMRGQIAEHTNSLIKHLGPPVQTILNLDANNETYHRETSKGQVIDPPNAALVLAQLTSPGIPGSVVINPVYKKAQWQDTQVAKNLLLTNTISSSAPVVPIIFDDQIKHRDTLAGQFSRVTAYLPQPQPFISYDSLYTLVQRNRSAQDPFIFPNDLILGIGATPLPFVNQTFDQLHLRGKKIPEPFDFPNTALYTNAPVRPFVQQSYDQLHLRGKKSPELYDAPNATFFKPPANIAVLKQTVDDAIRGKKTQEPWIYQNPLLIHLTPFVATPPIVQRQSEDLQWRGHKTQEHYDFSNTLLFTLPPPVVAGFEVMAVTAGYYNGVYYQPGDVFVLNFAHDFSDSSVNYGPNSGTTQYGWMTPTGRTAFDATFLQPIPLLPIIDPVPPKRFVY